TWFNRGSVISSEDELNRDLDLIEENEDFQEIESQATSETESSTRQNTVKSADELGHTDVDEDEDKPQQDNERHRVRYFTTHDDKIQKINTEIAKVKLDSVKFKSLVYEKEAIEKPKWNESTSEEVKKTLSKKRSPVKCPECDNYFERPGLKTHMTRKH
ncbi:unnamed protein product, partial [Brachionus calyciflorus]